MKNRKIQGRLIATAAGVLLASLDPAIAQDASSAGSFELRPGVVVDPGRGRAYVMTPEGGIDAVDIRDGTTIWETTEAAKPLALANDLLVAQADQTDAENELELVTLDADSGGERGAARAVDLPPGIEVSIDESLEKSFVANARPAGEEVLVVWAQSEQVVQGIAPGTDEEQDQGALENAPTRSAITSGAFQIDAVSGEISPVAPEAALQLSPVRAALELAEPDRISGVSGPQFLSADGRHAMTSERIGDDSVWEKYRWTVFDRETGEAVGTFATHLPLSPFFVSDDRIVYETGPFVRQDNGALVEETLKIRAVSLATGEEVWNEPIRDTAYRGPLPP